MIIRCSRDINNQSELDKFIGTDLWVKVHNKSMDDISYIHILSATEDSYKYKECYFTDDEIDEPVNQDTYDYFMDESTAYVDLKSNFELVYPVECFSTDELFPIK